MMADRPSDRLVNEGQLSWTLMCVRFDVMTLLNNIIYSFNQLYIMYIGIPSWPEVAHDFLSLHIKYLKQEHSDIDPEESIKCADQLA